MESFLQIAPHSLAIVLARVGADAAVVSESDELPRHHTGYEIFADFKAENSQQQIWNQRITEAVSEIFFLGWIDEHVLLIQGKEDHLEVLREEWMRRSLNPPRGFTIKYLGDVSPISMSPISQSQFIPLGDVLLLAISSINSAQKPVTEEALMEHLQTCFPGVPMPTEEALQHTLSILVHERKIYPTSDGYFIVTPQTYFITPSQIQTSSTRYHLDERSADRHHHQKQQQNQQTQCTFPLSGTITPSASGGLRDQAHSRSTQNHHAVGDACFYNNSCRTDDQPSPHTTLQPPSPKNHREAYSSKHCLQTPPQQTGGNTEKNRGTLGLPFKADTLTKQRGGIVEVGGTGDLEKQAVGYSTLGRKFGLKLFRFSFKKDKAKQLATFSAQFPPEEWPLHDEEDSSHLPRHVEMEIIRKINPDLTVENLARHTAVMKRLEEERSQRSKVSSANQSSRSRRSGGKHRKQSETKPSRPHIKTKAFCFESSDGTHMQQPDRDYRGYSSSLARSPREQALAMERQGAWLHLAHSIPNVLESSHVPIAPEWDVSGQLAKRHMEMPFPEPSHDPIAHHPKVYHSHSHTQERKSRRERSSKAKERSKSVDNSKGPINSELIGTSNYYNDHNHCYTDNGPLRASQRSSHYTHTAPLTIKGPADSLGSKGGRNLEKNKTKDSLPAYSPTPLLVSNPTDVHFQCPSNSEATLTKTNTMSSLGKNSHEELKPSTTERRKDRNIFHPTENTEDLPKVLSMPDPSASNEQLLNGTLSGWEKHKEIFNKDTFFKPLPSLSLSGCSSLRKATDLASITQSSSCNALDSHKGFDAPKSLVAAQSTFTQATGSTSSAAVASSDYYNVSDDDELEEGDEGSREKGKRSGLGLERCKAGTMQWLLERENAIYLQRRFERTLTLSGAKENHQEPHQSQLSAHSARLDSMDSSSVTVDSGFNSPRTRESLASNTSSVMEQNRRQNVPVTFDTLEPTSTQPENVQKPNVCHASITSV